jgi:site-specific recombinase XerD
VTESGRKRKQRSSARAPASDRQTLEDFLTSLAARSASGATIRAYRSDLTRLIDWLRREHLGVANLDRRVVARYADETGQGLAPATVARKLASLRAFLLWLSERDIIAPGAAELLRGPRRSPRVPEALPQADVERLFAAARDADNRSMGRDSLILELLYTCGLRSAEAVGLRVGDITSDGWLRVHGKGGRTRVLPLVVTVQRAVDNYLAHRPESASDALLLSHSGRPLDTSAVRRTIYRLARAAGLHGVHPHTLRHCCATHMLEGGADIRAIQEMLGHASISTTQGYTAVSPQYLRAAHATAHPRGGMP